MKAFDGSEFEKYKAEAEERWGDTDSYREHAGKTKGYGKDTWNRLAAELEAIFGEFAVCMKNGTAPDAEEAQSLVKKLQSHITENFYRCTNEILAGLGQMYVADERFKNNIDKYGAGTAEFAAEAIETYCRKA